MILNKVNCTFLLDSNMWHTLTKKIWLILLKYGCFIFGNLSSRFIFWSNANIHNCILRKQRACKANKRIIYLYVSFFFLVAAQANYLFHDFITSTCAGFSWIRNWPCCKPMKLWKLMTKTHSGKRKGSWINFVQVLRNCFHLCGSYHQQCAGPNCSLLHIW